MKHIKSHAGYPSTNSHTFTSHTRTQAFLQLQSRECLWGFLDVLFFVSCMWTCSGGHKQTRTHRQADTHTNIWKGKNYWVPLSDMGQDKSASEALELQLLWMSLFNSSSLYVDRNFRLKVFRMHPWNIFWGRMFFEEFGRFGTLKQPFTFTAFGTVMHNSQSICLIRMQCRKTT